MRWAAVVLLLAAALARGQAPRGLGELVLLDLSGLPPGRLDSRGAASFELAFAQGSGPGPRLASVLTSEYPEAEGVFRQGERLPQGAPNLARSLSEAGYATVAFWGDASADPGLDGIGFSTVVRSRTIDAATAGALALLARGGPPSFLLIHGRGSPERCLEAVRRLRRALEARGRGRFTLVVVSAEDRPGQGLCERALHTALAAWSPAAAPGRSRAVSELIGIAPTILQMAGLPAPASFQGRPWRLAPVGAPARRPLAFSSWRGRVSGDMRELSSVRDGGWRLVYDRTSGQAALFEASDVEGRRDKSAERPQIALDLTQTLLRHAQQAGSGQGPPRRLLDELRERGYW